MENRKTTIKELAKHANVSISTVSKALKDSPEISETTKKKIQRLAKIHQYSPNNLAVSFKSGKSQLLGVVLPNLSKMLYSNILFGIEQNAKQNAYKIIVSFSNDSIKTEKEITHQFFKSSIDGLIVIPCEETIKENDFQHLNHVAENGIPTLLLSPEKQDATKSKLNNHLALNNTKKSMSTQKSNSILDVGIWLKQFQEFFNFSSSENLAEHLLRSPIIEKNKSSLYHKKSISFRKKKKIGLSKYIKTTIIHSDAEQNEIKIGQLASQSILNVLTPNIKPFFNQIN
jgi:transcriptional regulator with XRE-family HTH domain